MRTLQPRHLLLTATFVATAVAGCGAGCLTARPQASLRYDPKHQIVEVYVQGQLVSEYEREDGEVYTELHDLLLRTSTLLAASSAITSTIDLT